MPRPRMNRRIRHQPIAQFYKPQGVPMGQLRGVTLTLDGLEALRLADAEGMEHEQAAELMGVSRPTFSRLLSEARGIVAKGLVNGWAIRIEGGNYELAGEAPPCGRGRRRCRRGAGALSDQLPNDTSISADQAGHPPKREKAPILSPYPGRQWRQRPTPAMNSNQGEVSSCQDTIEQGPGGKDL